MKDKKRTYEMKRITVDAYQVTENNLSKVAEWCGGQESRTVLDAQAMIEIDSGAYSVQVAELGDYIVKFPLVNAFMVFSPLQFNQIFQLAAHELLRDGDMWPEGKHGKAAEKV